MLATELIKIVQSYVDNDVTFDQKLKIPIFGRYLDNKKIRILVGNEAISIEFCEKNLKILNFDAWIRISNNPSLFHKYLEMKCKGLKSKFISEYESRLYTGSSERYENIPSKTLNPAEEKIFSTIASKFRDTDWYYLSKNPHLSFSFFRNKLNEILDMKIIKPMKYSNLEHIVKNAYTYRFVTFEEMKDGLDTLYITDFCRNDHLPLSHFQTIGYDGEHLVYHKDITFEILVNCILNSKWIDVWDICIEYVSPPLIWQLINWLKIVDDEKFGKLCTWSFVYIKSREEMITKLLKSTSYRICLDSRIPVPMSYFNSTFDEDTQVYIDEYTDKVKLLDYINEYHHRIKWNTLFYSKHINWYIINYCIEKYSKDFPHDDIEDIWIAIFSNPNISIEYLENCRHKFTEKQMTALLLNKSIPRYYISNAIENVLLDL